MLYIKIGNTSSYSYYSWEDKSTLTWGEASVFTWKDLSIIRDNTYLFQYYMWNDQKIKTWNDLKTLTWSDVFMNGEPLNTLYPFANSLSIMDVVNDQSTCDLRIFDSLKTANFRRGQPITIYNENMDIVFSGFIYNVIKKHFGSYPSIAMEYTISCVDNHYLINKRKLVKAFIGETINVAVQWILDNILVDEGILAGSIIASTKTITKSYNYVALNDVLDELADYASFIWFIDANKKLYFIPANTYATPFDIILDENCKCPYIKDGTFSVNDENSEYINTEYLTGSTNKTILQTQSFKGDGENQTWTLKLPVAEEPIIKVNNVIKTVGINTIDTGKDFYYTIGDPYINQDSAGAKLISSDILTIEFIGSYSIVVKSANYEEIEKRALLEGSSGIVESISNDTNYTTENDALEKANILINTYGIDAKIIQYTTREEGLEAGQIQHIYSEIYNLDDECLISQVEKSDVDYEIENIITAIVGPINDYWTKQMLKFATAKDKLISNSVETSETILISWTFDKTWTSIEDPNIFKNIYPSDTIFSNSNFLPCFDNDDKCSYIQFNTVDDYRVYRTTQIITANQIITTFIIPTDKCNDENGFTQIKFYGGNIATDAINSGVLLSTHTKVYTKNNLESIQIIVTYNKWS